LVDINLRVTEPATVSVLLGWYVVDKLVLDGLNVPVPELDQIPVPVVDVPVRLTFGLFPQTVILFPAVTVTLEMNVITMVSVTGLQFPLPVDVSTSVTLPAVVSALLGLYEPVNEVLDGVNVPVPELDHCPVEVGPETAPASEIEGLVAQIV